MVLARVKLVNLGGGVILGCSMAVLPSWASDLPQSRAQEEDLLRAALARAHDDVAEIERDKLGPKTVTNRLGAAAADAVRITCLLRRGGTSVVLPYVPLFHRAVLSIDDLTDPYGVLAFANVMLTHGATLDGWHDASTTAGLEREVAVLERAARSGQLSRVLAFAALGAGRDDLVRKLSRDPLLHGLAEACTKRDANAFHAFVAGFPASDVGYAELLFVARAFVVILLERGPGGIHTAAEWLHSTVHEGPKALPVGAPATSPDRPQLNEGAAVKTGPSPFRWSVLEYSDRHGLWGGMSIAVSSIGDYELIDTSVHHQWRRFRATVDRAALLELDALIARHPPPSKEPRPPPLPAIPDSVTESLSLVVEGRIVSLSDISDAENASFCAIKSWLINVGTPRAP